MERLVPYSRMFRSPLALLPFLAALGTACSRGADTSDAGTDEAPSRVEGQRGSPDLPPGLQKAPSATPPGSAEPPAATALDAGVTEPPRGLSVFPKQPEHSGPWFVVTSPAAGVYSEPSFERSAKLGWVRSGGKLPVRETGNRKGCTPGWYEVIGGGFI